jgi:hypothetical protein
VNTPPPDARWIWVSLPRATFALIVRGGRVIDAAPYGRRYLGWDERRAAATLRRAGARFEPLPH